MSLSYLIFDISDDGTGTGTWDAMASVRADRVPDVLAEVQRVLDWAQAHSPGARGALDEGGVWDADQQVRADGEWTVITFTLTGPVAWGEAMLAALAPNE